MKFTEIAELMKEIRERKWYKEMMPVKWKIVDGKTAFYHFKINRIDIPISRMNENTILHELAHHIEYKHVRGFIRYRGVMHGKNFWTILARLPLRVNLSEITTKLRSYPKAPGWQWMPATKKWGIIE